MSATCIVVNATAAALSNVNAGGDDIPAYSMGVGGAGTASLLTAAEQDALAAQAGVAIIGASSTQEQRRLISKILRLGKNPGTVTS